MDEVRLGAVAVLAPLLPGAALHAVMDATMHHVLHSYASMVGPQVDAADGPEAMLVAYLRKTIGYLREHPAHVRVLVEGLVRDRDGDRELAPGSPEQASRWQGVATILRLGQEAGTFRAFDTRALALVIGGALDGVVAEWVGDRAFDLGAAAVELETAVLLAVRAPEFANPVEERKAL